MALAIYFDQLISDGTVANLAELARLGRVSRARLSQVMTLVVTMWPSSALHPSASAETTPRPLSICDVELGSN